MLGVVTSLSYNVNDEINITMDRVGTFVIWLEFLLVPVNARVSYLSILFVYDMLFIHVKLIFLTL